MEKLYTLLEEIRPDVDFRNITTLVTDGFIDSFDIVSIIASIEDEFAVEIPVVWLRKILKVLLRL